jgi:hypothetical protein
MSDFPLLIVAFDGLDSELVRDFDLENLTQDEHGEIDNNTGMFSRITSEEFAALVTGETYKEHGISELEKYQNSNRLVQKIEDKVKGTKLGVKTRKLRKVLYLNLEILGLNNFERRKWYNKDLPSENLFNKIDLSKPLFVPSYNPDLEWLSGFPNIGLKYGHRIDDLKKKARENTERRLEKFENVSVDFWNLVFLHLHDPDTIQHYTENKEELRKEYERLDEIAGEIVEEYGDTCEIVFLSDHGMPVDGYKGHNKNAFYSTNFESFPNSKPHITEFYDLILNKLE